MFQIGDKIISRELFEKHFICHLEECEGNCCVFGDSGAPLEKDEAESLAINLDKIHPYFLSCTCITCKDFQNLL